MITKNSLTDLENITKLRFCQIIKNKIMSPDYLNMCHSSFTFSPVPTSNIVPDWTQIGLITIFVPIILHIFLLLLGHFSICYCPCWNKIWIEPINIIHSLNSHCGAWALRGRTALKSILWETFFLDQLHDFSLLSLNSFLPHLWSQNL